MPTTKTISHIGDTKLELVKDTYDAFVFKVDDKSGSGPNSPKTVMYISSDTTGGSPSSVPALGSNGLVTMSNAKVEDALTANTVTTDTDLTSGQNVVVGNQIHLKDGTDVRAAIYAEADPNSGTNHRLVLDPYRQDDGDPNDGPANDGTVFIRGNLVVQGDKTILDTVEHVTAENLFGINAVLDADGNVTGGSTETTAGISVYSGTDNKQFIHDFSTGKWRALNPATSTLDDLEVKDVYAVDVTSTGTAQLVDLNATGTSTLTNVDINGGVIDGTAIGTDAQSTGKFTTLDVIHANGITTTKLTAGTSITATGSITANDRFYGNITSTGTSNFSAVNVSGDLGVDGNFDVGTNYFTVASATGNTAIAGTLGVTGDTTLSANASVGGTLGVTGATTLSNTLAVTGATTLSSTLGVTGDTTLSGDASVGGTLGVTGDTTLSANASVGGTLGVTGATTLSNTLAVTGATTLSSTLGVTGDTTLSANASVGGTLGVTNATTLSSTLGVTGATTLSSTLAVTGATTLSSTLGVTGDTTLSANASVGGTLGVTNATTLSSTLDVTGATTLSSTLGVTGATTLSTLGVSGATTLSSTLAVAGTTSLAGDFNINTDKFTVASSTGNTSIAGDLSVTGTITGNLASTGATLTGALNLNQANGTALNILSDTVVDIATSPSSASAILKGGLLLENDQDIDPTGGHFKGSFYCLGGGAFAKTLYANEFHAGETHLGPFVISERDGTDTYYSAIRFHDNRNNSYHSIFDVGITDGVWTRTIGDDTIMVNAKSVSAITIGNIVEVETTSGGGRSKTISITSDIAAAPLHADISNYFSGITFAAGKCVAALTNGTDASVAMFSFSKCGSVLTLVLDQEVHSDDAVLSLDYDSSGTIALTLGTATEAVYCVKVLPIMTSDSITEKF